MIVDGHPSHRSKLVKTYVESLQGKLRLFFLLPCSSWLTPDELVCKDVKNNGVSQTPIHGPKDLARTVVGRLGHQQKSPTIVRPFFRARDTRYAAL